MKNHIIKLMLTCITCTICAAMILPSFADQIIGYQPRQPETEAPAVQTPPAEPAQNNNTGNNDTPAEGENPAAETPTDGEETTTDDDFIAPDTYPAYLAPQFAAETPEGISYLESEDGTHIMIVGYRGYASDGGTVIIPDAINGIPVTEIAESAFAGDTAIRRLTIPDSVQIIGEYAVSLATSLEYVSLPAGMTEIPAGMFDGCRSLREITLPSGLKTIGDNAFSGCTSLTTLTIPASVSLIGIDAFSGCEQLIFDCADNLYAADYAEVNGIEIRGGRTWNGMVIEMAIITAVLALAVIFVPRIINRMRKKKNG